MIWEKPIQNTRNFLNQPTYLPINLWPGFGNNQPTYLIKKDPINHWVTYPLEKLGSWVEVEEKEPIGSYSSREFDVAASG